MDFTERLQAVGITKGQFADLLGVSRQAVGNWSTRGLPDEAEKLLSELESPPEVQVGEPFPLNCLVNAWGRGPAKVIRIDRCETNSGHHKVYWCSEAKKEENGWSWSGPAGQYPPKYLKRLPDVEWIDSHVRKPEKG